MQLNRRGVIVKEVNPILLNISPWDATRGVSVYYIYTGSKQAFENELVITDVASKAIVYSFTFKSFEKVHHIPPNELINGRLYSAKIRVKDKVGIQSPYSSEVRFRTFKTPILDIQSIDEQGYVYNKDVTFEAKYTQDDGENVKNYRFNLYDENEDLVKNFPVRIPSELNIITETIGNLLKANSYFIECIVETVNGMVYTHRERFIPLYIIPSINGVISTSNNPDEGFINVSANLKQITGTQVQGVPTAEVESGKVDNYKYIGEDWIVIPEGNPVMFSGLGMNRASDFTMKVWCRDIPSEKMFMELSTPYDDWISIEFWKYKDRVVAVKDYNGVRSLYRSNILDISGNANFMLFVKVVEHRIDLSIKIVT